FPHWGTEYDPTPFRGQQTLARAALDAGADMVIGNHAHWAGAMEVYKGKPIWYALGNFVFDQTWSEPTMEGITLELTFRGKGLVQAHIRPHIILDKAQPNFLDPAGAGKVVMGQVFSASKGLAPWETARRSPRIGPSRGSAPRPATRAGCRPRWPSRPASPRARGAGTGSRRWHGSRARVSRPTWP